MRKLKFIYVIVFVTILKSISTAQTPASDFGCGAKDLLDTARHIDPNIDSYFSDYESQLQYKTNSNPTMAAGPYTIPVVFHVIYDGSVTSPAVSYDQIKWQLATLNAAFSNSLNAFMGQTNGTHGVNTNINFCFAKQKKSGATYTVWPNSTPGMISYTTSSTSITSIDMSSPSTFTALAALTNYTANFPGTNYLNIWCVPNICNGSGCVSTASPTIIGFGTFPWMTLSIDGIVIRRDCIGNNSYNSNFPMYTPFDKGLSLVHEAGHYLGLFHSFETLLSSSSLATGTVGCYGTSSASLAVTQGDLIADTPPTKINSNVGIGPLNTCAETYSPYAVSADENDQLENHMSYTNDDYLNTFTQQQAWRMYGALDPAWSSTVAFSANTRTVLTTATNLSNTGVTISPSCGPGLLTSAFSFSITSAATCSTAPVQFYMPNSWYLTATSYTWNFGDGNTLITSTPTNPSHTYTTAPYSFTVTLTVASGTTTSATTKIINLPGNSTKIVGQSSSGITVCKGSEQTIVVQFPAGVYSAQITDGTNIYTVYNNFVLAAGNNNNKVPFTIPIYSNSTFSLVPASCGTLNLGSATFSVTDCCTNLTTNGNLESGNSGFISDFYISPSSIGPGSLRADIPSLVTGASWSSTSYVPDGKSLTTDGITDPSNTPVIIATNTVVNPCNNLGVKKIIFGQTLSGLKPGSNYYITFKATESYDFLAAGCGPINYAIKLYNSSTTLLNQANLMPALFPPTLSGSNQINYWTVFGFAITTPTNITTATSFSLELYQMDYFGATGFDYLIDNIFIQEMKSSIVVGPSSTTTCPSATVQLSAIGNCASISNYNLTWQPSGSLSCSTCSNPIASPIATTVYTLVAVPPITTPPTPNIIQTLTVNVIPTISIAISSPTPLCNSSTYTLTATGATSYTWQPGNISGNSITVAPTSSTIYTVSGTGTSGTLSCTGTKTVQITPPIVPTLTISPDPNPICFGQSSGLTALGGATSFTWQPGALTGSNVIVSPTITTTYTVYGSGGSCPVNPGILTITVNPLPSLTVSATPQLFCVPTTASLTVNGANTYTWEPGTLYGSSVTVTPTVTTNYTVSGTNTLTGCDNSKTITVYFTSCTDCTVGISLAPSATTVTGTSYINNTYNVQNDLTINGAVTFSNTSVLISPNKKIIVASGATLTIDNSHLLACSDMWDGIVLQGSAKIILLNNSLIEDAKIAIDASSVDGSVNHINSNKGVFNKNYVGIKFNGQTLYGNTHKVLDIRTTIFTKRNLYTSIATSSGTLINSSPVNSTTLNVYNTSGGNSLAYQYSVSTLSNASFKTSTTSWTVPVGIYCVNTGSNNAGGGVPTTGSTWYDLAIGTCTNNSTTNNTYKCVFDNLHYGVYAENSNLNIVNTAFQNIYGMDDEGFNIGEAIHAVNTNTATYHHLVAKNGAGTSSGNSLCDFIENYKGVVCKDYSIVDVSNNRSYSNITYSPPPYNFGIGWMTFWVSSYKYVNIDLKNNNIKNIAFPITFYSGIPTSTSTAVANLGNVNINTNVIDGLGSSRFVITGIIVDNVAASTTFTNISSLKTTAQGNSIANCFNGIECKNWNSSFPSAVMSANNIVVKSSGVSSDYQYGIYVANNSTHAITTNTVAGYGYVSTDEYAKNLVWSGSNTTASVTCNVLKDFGRGFVFDGNNGSSKWLLNTIQNADKGLVLSNTGLIGTQGSSSSACDNYWGGTWTGRSETFVRGTSTATSSILYVRASAGYSPTLNNYETFSIDVPYGPTTLLSASSSTIGCGGGGGGGGKFMSKGIEYDIDIMEKIVGGIMKYDINNIGDDFNYKFQVYRVLRNDSSILSQSPALNGFYNSNKNGVMEMYCNIEENLGRAKNNNVISTLGSYISKNNIEANYDLYYRLYDKINNGAYSQKTDGITLYNLANRCPHSDGLIIYNARSLYNFINQTHEKFNDCELNSSSKLSNNYILNSYQNYMLYPNPSTGKINLVSLNEFKTNSNIEVKDVTGKLVYKTDLLSKETKAELNLDVKDGIYFVILYENGLQTFAQKIIISK